MNDGCTLTFMAEVRLSCLHDNEFMKLLRCFNNSVASMNQENGGIEAAQNNDAKKPSYSQAEAETICSHLSLSSVSLGRYLVLLRSDFDVDIAGEPYLALSLLLNLDSGKFFTRVCDQTVTRGHAHSIEELVSVLCTLLQCGPLISSSVLSYENEMNNKLVKE